MRGKVPMVVGTLLAATGAFVAGGPARAAGAAGSSTTATISGTVTNTGGAPLGDMCVTAFPEQSPQLPWQQPQGYSAAPTDTSGTYSIGGLPPGPYLVRFAPCSGYGRFPVWHGQTPQYDGYGNPPMAIFLAAGQVLTGVDGQLGPGSVISGTITDSSGAPLAGACVRGWITPGDPTDAVVTDAAGSYALPVRAGEPYSIEADPCQAGNHLSAVYGGSAQPTKVSAPFGQPTRGVDLTLPDGGSITGTITDPSGNPLPGACASAIGGASSQSIPADSQGLYRIDQLATGTYHVSFHACRAGNYHDANYPATVSVTAGATTTGIDASLSPAGSISGTVTDAAGNPAVGVCAWATPTSSGASYSSPASDSSGHYQIDYMTTGTYTVSFRGCWNRNVITSWYKGAADSSGATPVSVTDGQDTPGIDDQVSLGGEISGMVRDSAGDRVGACVKGFNSGGLVITDAGASDYDMWALSPDTYKVEFTPCYKAAVPFVTQWYNDRPDQASADPLPLASGQQLSGIDAVVQLSNPVEVVSMSPAYGQSPGGNSVVIRGQGFTGTTSVTFGQAAATFTVDSDNQITAVAPPSSPNVAVNVTVTSPAGSGQAPTSYWYNASPTVTSISPDEGAWQGGDSVVLTGSGFTGTAGVSFGGLPARSFSVVDDSHLDVVTPTADISTVDVTVTNMNGTGQRVPTDVFHFTPGATATTSTDLTLGSADSTEGQPVTLTAVVSQSGTPAPPPTGPVTFYDGSSPLGQADLDSTGTARMTIPLTEEGTHSITASYEGDLYNAPSNSAAGTVVVADAAIQATGTALSGATGTTLSGVVASFTDADPNGAPSDYSASVDWGDGTTGPGSVSAGPNGTWDVSGSHTYAAAGTYSISVAIDDAGGSSATAQSTAGVVAPADTVTSLSAGVRKGTEGQPLTLTASVESDSSSTPGPTGVVTFYNDGQPIGQAQLGAGGQAQLGFVPSEEGRLWLTAGYSGDGYNLPSSSAKLGLTVTDAPLDTVGSSLRGTEGTMLEAAQPVSGTVATFTDADPNGTLSDYSATIDWGDGTIGPGTISASGSGWVVSGSHTYDEDGSYTVLVTVEDAGGSVSRATSTATVNDPPDLVNQAVDAVSDATGG